MSTTNQLLLSYKAYQETRSALHRDAPSQSASPQVANPDVLINEPASLSGGSLLLGTTEAGASLHLNLYDPTPGPLLVAGDRGSGKTVFLKSLARVSGFQNPGDISFGVLSPFPEEWTAMESLPHCLGVWPFYHPSASDFISQMVSWSEVLRVTRQVVLLLVDGLDLMTGSDFTFQYYLRWLLLNGPERHIWPVITINPARLARLQTWLDYFHTRVIGQVKYALTARSLVEDSQIDLADLRPGNQFGLFQSGNRVKFCLPPLE